MGVDYVFGHVEGTGEHYWNGPDELLAVKDESPYQGIDALLAYRKKLLDEKMYLKLMEVTKDKLASVGIEDLNSAREPYTIIRGPVCTVGER